MRLAFFLGLLAAVSSLDCGGSVSSEVLAEPPASGEVGSGGGVGGDETPSESAGEVLFACERAGGTWPATQSSRLIVEHVGGTTFRVNGEAFVVASVQKHGPWPEGGDPNSVTYRLLAANGWEYWLHGQGAPFEAMQLALFKEPGVRTKATTSSWNCPHREQWVHHLREHPSALPGEFDDARLDALVTATGGKRFRF